MIIQYYCNVNDTENIKHKKIAKKLIKYYDKTLLMNINSPLTFKFCKSVNE